MEGDTTETIDTTDTATTSEAIEALESEAPRTEQHEPEEQPDGQVTAEQLCGYVERASFATKLGRRGYQQGEVDSLLVKIAEALRAGEPLADLVRRTQLSPVRLEDGYDKSQVDDFLSAVVDLDPHAEAAHRPEVGRSGLVTKLFG